jgi:hypothetical protein
MRTKEEVAAAFRHHLQKDLSFGRGFGRGHQPDAVRYPTEDELNVMPEIREAVTIHTRLSRSSSERNGLKRQIDTLTLMEEDMLASGRRYLWEKSGCLDFKHAKVEQHEDLVGELDVLSELLLAYYFGHSIIQYKLENF